MIPDDMADRGACYEAIEYYPRKRSYYGYNGGGVFARRYFNAALEEVGYFLTALGSYHYFMEEPRVWAEEYLSQLTWVECYEQERHSIRTDSAGS